MTPSEQTRDHPPLAFGSRIQALAIAFAFATCAAACSLLTSTDGLAGERPGDGGGVTGEATVDDGTGSVDAGTGIRLRGSNLVSLSLSPATTVSVPASVVQPGDSVWVMLAIQSRGFVPATPSVPFDNATAPAWVQDGSGCPNGNISYIVFTRFATADEPSAYTFTVAQPTGIAAVLLAFEGVDPAQPIDAELGGGKVGPDLDGGGALTYGAPSITTRSRGSLLLYFFGDNAGGTWADPAPPTVRVADGHLLEVFARAVPEPVLVAPTSFGIASPCGRFTNGFLKVVALRAR